MARSSLAKVLISCSSSTSSNGVSIKVSGPIWLTCCLFLGCQFSFCLALDNTRFDRFVVTSYSLTYPASINKSVGVFLGNEFSWINFNGFSKLIEIAACLFEFMPPACMNGLHAMQSVTALIWPYFAMRLIVLLSLFVNLKMFCMPLSHPIMLALSASFFSKITT